ncbi:MAG TPA: hypothetical protein VN203_23375 [Candidatus Acidoferrum sp.]|nr:hypothetical protein [Candidatus Acidoferrum sp.]
MSLRKSPVRTPALLAANRANAQKSTGPRTPQGKSRVVLNALRHGRRSPNFLATLRKSGQGVEEFLGILQALFVALLPQNKKEMKWVSQTAAYVWIRKREGQRVVGQFNRQRFRGRSATLTVPCRRRYPFLLLGGCASPVRAGR